MTPTPPPTPSPDDLHSRAITYLLLAVTVLFSLILIAVDKFFPTDGQVFQVLAGLTTGFAGAFMMRVTPARPGAPTDGSSVQIAAPSTSTITPVKPLGIQPMEK